MPVSIVVGGQFGSEGKGKVAAWLAIEHNAVAAVRCGGTNSGHTVYDEAGQKYIFRQLPTACLQPGVKCVLAAGTYIDVEVLLTEIELSGIRPENLLIDPQAIIISDEDKLAEVDNGLTRDIGSTGSGTGAALLRRLSRGKEIQFAKDEPALQVFLCKTKQFFARVLARDERVIIEGTQGYGLSVLHSGHYPFVTSRDTTASGFLSECGISPLYVDDIYMVIRTFPIRVSGSSGQLENEISWAKLVEESGLNEGFVERTSVTREVRRIGRFEDNIVLEAIVANYPTKIVLNHLDYIKPDKREKYLQVISQGIGRGIDYVGLDPQALIPNQHNRQEHMLVVSGLAMWLL